MLRPPGGSGDENGSRDQESHVGCVIVGVRVRVRALVGVRVWAIVGVQAIVGVRI